MMDILAFYTFLPIEDPETLRDQLLESARAHQLMGTILVSPEGINCMLAGLPDDTTAFEADLRSDARFADVWVKRSSSQEMPFKHLKAKVKPEIVTMRVEGVNAVDTGKHVAPEEFRDWLRSGEDMFVIDTRNDFEFKMGTFQGAENPETTAFHEFPDYILERKETLAEKKVVMFCTGGIRCEKATSWMKTLGLENVYQLEGGILNYFERIADADQDWKGDLFVFDERVGINTHMQPTDASLCPECGAARSETAIYQCPHPTK